MSYNVFTHNNHGVINNGYPAGAGLELQGQTCFEAPIARWMVGGNDRSLIRFYNDGQTILANWRQKDHLWISDDAGQTWDQIPINHPYGSNNPQPIYSIDYDPVNDVIYNVQYTSGSRQGWWYKSLDRGQSWINMGNMGRYAYGGKVNPHTLEYFAVGRRVNNGATITKFPTPWKNNENSYFRYNGPSNPGGIRTIGADFAVNMLNDSRWVQQTSGYYRNFIDLVVFTTEDLHEEVRLNDQGYNPNSSGSFTIYDDALNSVTQFSAGETTGVAQDQKNSPSNTYQFYMYHFYGDITVDPPPSVTLDFGELAETPSMQFGDNIHMVMCRSYNEPKKHIFYWCDPCDMETWYGPNTLYTQRNNKSNNFQIEHWKDGEWVIAYIEDGADPGGVNNRVVAECFSLGFRVPSPNLISSHPETIDAVEGDTVAFEIGKTGSGDITWFRGGAPQESETQESLEFDAALEDDETRIFARVVDGCKTEYSKGAWLHVESFLGHHLASPLPEAVVAFEGTNKTVSVSMRYPVQDYTFQWYINGLAQSGATGPDFTFLPVRSIMDGGRIRVDISYLEGSVFQSEDIDLTVLE